MKSLLTFLFLLFLSACGGSGLSNVYSEPVLTAVDSTNDRLFVLEKQGVLFAYLASDRTGIGDQPLVDENTLESVNTALPSAPTHMAVLRSSTTSRLFIAGVQELNDGTQVFNQILVLDFDGTTFSEASISPIVLSDNDATTDESNDLVGGLAVDADNSRLYVTDATTGKLFILDPTTGAQANAPLDIAGTPNRMALDNGRLYVANSDATAANQVISVFDISDLTIAATTIDLDAPVDDISVLSNNTGTVLLAKERGTQRVFVQLVNTATFAATTDIAVADTSAANGELTPGLGITSSVSRIVLARGTDDAIYGYTAQSDGLVGRMTISADLTSFTSTTLSSTAEGLTGSSVYTDSNGDGVTFYTVGSTSGDLVYTTVGSSIVSIRS